MIQDIIKTYVDLFAKIFEILEIPGLRRNTNSKSIDERISKIEQAKHNLLESLNVIDELKKEAENNKLEFEKTINDLNRIRLDKNTLETEYDSLKQLSDRDLKSLKSLIGIQDKNRERIIGFMTGIITSLIASGIIYLISYFVE